jgi:hypothetical protein
MKVITTLLVLYVCLLSESVFAQTTQNADSTMKKNGTVTTTSTAKDQQLILWTSGDREVALKMVFMYALNCQKRSWMDQVRVLVWGPSGKLLVEDKELQEKLKELKSAGVELYACKGCADLYGISDQLTQLGITVMYTGQMLADLQKTGWHVLAL